MIKARHSNIDASQSRETTHHRKHQVGDLYLENLLGNLRKNMAKLKRLSRTQRRGLAETMSQKNSLPEAFPQGNSNPARALQRQWGFAWRDNSVRKKLPEVKHQTEKGGNTNSPHLMQPEIPSLFKEPAERHLLCTGATTRAQNTSDHCGTETTPRAGGSRALVGFVTPISTGN